MIRASLCALLGLFAANRLWAADLPTAPLGEIQFFGTMGLAVLEGAPVGLAGQAGLALSLPRPLILELGAAYYVLGTGTVYYLSGDDFGAASENLALIPITAGLSYAFPQRSALGGYIGAGAGIYHLRMVPTRATDPPSDAPRSTSARLGINLGAGVQGLPGHLAPRVDLRLHRRSIGPNEGVGSLTSSCCDRAFYLVTATIGLHFP